MTFETPTELPFFEPRHRESATRFRDRVGWRLARFETNEGGDGRAAREIFQILARVGWLASSALPQSKESTQPIDLRGVCLMREADVALSAPWLAALPLALCGSDEQKSRYLEQFCAGECLPAFARG